MPGAYSGNVAYLTSILERHSLEVSLVGIATDSVSPRPHSTIVPGDGLIAQAKGAIAAVRKAIELKPSVVIITQAGSVFTAMLSLGLRAVGAHVIYFCADPPIELFKLRPLHPFVKRCLVAWLSVSQPVTDRTVASTLSLSPGLDNLLRKEGWRGTIRRFYNVHHTHFQGSPGRSTFRRELGWEDDVVLVYAGAYQKHFRGIEHQLEAVALARSMGAQVKFLGIGYSERAYSDRDYFPELAKKLGLQQHSVFYGSQDPETLSNLLADCDVAVSNSLPWALPSKIFEYINNGLEIVSAAGENDVNELCGEFVNLYDGTTEDLARALTRAKRSKSTERTLKGREFCAQLRLESERSIKEALHIVSSARAATQRR